MALTNIPATRVPGVYAEVNTNLSNAGIGQIKYKVLLVGQKTSAGTATALTPVRAFSKEEAATLFGAGSMLAIMAQSALAGNSYTEFWFMPVADNGSGVAASGSVAFGGSASVAGTLNLYIAGVNVQVPITASQSLSSIATATVAAINAVTALPVTAAVDGSVNSKVNLTAKNKGECGNTIDIRLNYYGETNQPAALTATITAMASGATNPTAAAIITAIGETNYQLIAWPFTDSSNIAALETELNSRFAYDRDIAAHAICSVIDTAANVITYAGARNNAHLTVVAGTGSPMPSFAIAAEVASITAFYAEIDPARPIQYLDFTYCLPPSAADLPAKSVRNSLLNAGAATVKISDASLLQVERLVTTYKTTSAGAPDVSYLDIETMLTLLLIRYDWKTYILGKYPRAKLANDGTRYGTDQVVVTPNVIKAECFVKFRQWETAGLVEDFESFKAGLIVQRNATDVNRLDVSMPPNIINQLRVLATSIQFVV